MFAEVTRKQDQDKRARGLCQVSETCVHVAVRSIVVPVLSLWLTIDVSGEVRLSMCHVGLGALGFELSPIVSLVLLAPMVSLAFFGS